MNYVCTGKGCSVVNAPVGTEMWKKQMCESGLGEKEVENVKKIILKLRQGMKPRNID